MPAHLIALNDGPNIPVDKPILLLGRHPECDIQIESRKISRRHCCIAQVNDYLVVRDLDSTNGIRINGVRVVEGRLKSGDELTIGNHRYQVTWDDGPPPHPPLRKGAVPPPPPLPMPIPLPPAGGFVDDDALEECDEPVPLPEPPRSNRATKVEAQPIAPAEEEGSLVIPEDLDLLPKSGEHSPHPK